MRNEKGKFTSLEKKRFIFLEIGIILVLAAVLLAFNYRAYNDEAFLDFDRLPDNSIEEFAPISVQPTPPPPLAPPPPTTLINIVDNTVDVEEDYIVDVEDNQLDEVDNYEPFIPEEMPEPEETIYVFPQKYPEFPGGEAARLQFLRDHVKYPQMAREAGISGTVYVQFIVEPDGSITHVEVLRGPGGGIPDEAIRVTQLMPNWEPGMQGGKKVRVQYRMPIKFVLQ
jgi:protein TonB